MSEDPSLNDSALADYRETLEERYAEMSASYDSNLIKLSGGALAVSFAFIKDVVPEPEPSTFSYVWYGWLCFALSLAAALFALLCSQYAVRRAIAQIDDGSIRSSTPGGKLAIATHVLTISGAVLFLAGVVLLAQFARVNLGS
jgi:hypothetical protein